MTTTVENDIKFQAALQKLREKRRRESMADEKAKMTDTELLNWLEEQAKSGSCIGLIHDDNGHWAVSGSGVQNCPTGRDPEDIDTTFFVFKGEWRDSIRKAIEAAVDANKEGESNDL